MTSQRVLLIDDDPLQLRTREAVLRNAGFEVCIATRAAGALALLRTHPVGSTIATIVADHVMPDTNGADFVRTARRIRPQIPIIVITGMPEAESEYDGLGVEFRQKPCHPTELIELVRWTLNKAA